MRIYIIFKCFPQTFLDFLRLLISWLYDHAKPLTYAVYGFRCIFRGGYYMLPQDRSVHHSQFLFKLKLRSGNALQSICWYAHLCNHSRQ